MDKEIKFNLVKLYIASMIDLLIVLKNNFTARLNTARNSLP